jgi:guanine deaminase
MNERLTDEYYLNEAFREAFRGIRNNHGGPFGAVIMKDGRIIGRGCNMVVSSNDPTAHAEIVAIREASAEISSYDLSGSTLFSTCEPCPMCFSAIYWANINEVIFSQSRHDAELMGFKDNHIYKEICKVQSERSIRFTKVDHARIRSLMEEWDLKTDKFHY